MLLGFSPSSYWENFLLKDAHSFVIYSDYGYSIRKKKLHIYAVIDNKDAWSGVCLFVCLPTESIPMLGRNEVFWRVANKRDALPLYKNTVESI